MYEKRGVRGSHTQGPTHPTSPTAAAAAPPPLGDRNLHTADRGPPTSPPFLFHTKKNPTSLYMNVHARSKINNWRGCLLMFNA